jgi:Na+/H+ antiporter NhaD/arsenite permease-like protein
MDILWGLIVIAAIYLWILFMDRFFKVRCEKITMIKKIVIFFFSHVLIMDIYNFLREQDWRLDFFSFHGLQLPSTSYC